MAFHILISKIKHLIPIPTPPTLVFYFALYSLNQRQIQAPTKGPSYLPTATVGDIATPPVASSFVVPQPCPTKLHVVPPPLLKLSVVTALPFTTATTHLHHHDNSSPPKPWAGFF